MTDWISMTTKKRKASDVAETRTKQWSLRVSANRQATQTEQKQAEEDTPYLDNYGIDLTKAAEGGKLDPVVGREKKLSVSHRF